MDGEETFSGQKGNVYEYKGRYLVDIFEQGEATTSVKEHR